MSFMLSEDYPRDVVGLTTHPETLLPISLHYKKCTYLPSEGAILKKGHFCPWPLPDLCMVLYSCNCVVYVFR